MKHLKKHKLITAVMLLQVFCASAQDHVSRARIRDVADSGFYRILLSPGDKRFARPYLGNLRIRNSQGREIPYIIEYGTRPNELVAIEDLSYNSFEDTAERKTVIDVKFAYPIQSSQMRMNIKAPVTYKREADISFTEAGTTGRSHHDIEIYSEEKNIFNFGLSSVTELRIEIRNLDDIPLSIGSIQFFQKPVYLICSLLPRETCYLHSLEMNTPSPAYDLTYFRNKISPGLPVAFLEEMDVKTTASQDAKKVDKRKEVPETRWFMWACIGVGGLMTLFFAMRLLSDMRRD
jgi:hypothetical protein